jgi:predicted ester cyclase
MSVEGNKEVVRRLYEEGMTTRNTELLVSSFAPGYRMHSPEGKTLEGRDASMEFLHAFLDAFPDMVFTVPDLLGEGDKVVARWIGTGTHTNEFRAFAPHEPGIPASGRKVSFTATDIYVVIDGEITEEWNTLHEAEVRHQLGACDPPR